MSDDSGMVSEVAPVPVLRVPLMPGATKVLSTHALTVGMVGFGSCSGVPKLQPVLLQSGAGVAPPGTGGMVLFGLTVQAGPTQLRLDRMTAPSGTTPSGAVPPPPPMLRPPQVRFLMKTDVPVRICPHAPPPAPVVKSKIVGVPPPVVVVVLLVVVEVVDELVVLDVELVVVDVVELVVLDVV